MTIQNKPIGWIILQEGIAPLRTGGCKNSAKLYKSEGIAKAAIKSSGCSAVSNLKAVPVYADPDYPVNPLTGRDILDIRMDFANEADAKTIGEYLAKLLTKLWYDPEGFNGKRPWGNSGWYYELYVALAKAKAIKAEYDFVNDEYDNYDKDTAEVLINRAIAALYES